MPVFTYPWVRISFNTKRKTCLQKTAEKDKPDWQWVDPISPAKVAIDAVVCCDSQALTKCKPRPGQPEYSALPDAKLVPMLLYVRTPEYEVVLSTPSPMIASPEAPPLCEAPYRTDIASTTRPHTYVALIVLLLCVQVFVVSCE